MSTQNNAFGNLHLLEVVKSALHTYWKQRITSIAC